MIPRLTVGDLLAQLRDARRADDERPVLILGHFPDLPEEGATLPVDGHEWSVLPVKGELGLREALVRVEEDSALCLLLDEDLRLPVDIEPRVARGRVQHVHRRARLAQMFGAQEVATALLTSPLATVLLEAQVPGLRPIGGTLLQLDEAWRQVLESWLGLQVSQGLKGLAVAAVERPLRARDLLQQWPSLQQELGLAVERLFGGPPAGLLWRAWSSGHGAEALAFVLLLHGARLAPDPRTAEARLQGALGYAPGADARLTDPAVCGPLLGQLPELLSALPGSAKEAVLRLAEGVAHQEEAQRASPFLPCAARALDAELAALLQACALAPSPELVRQAIRVVGRLDLHEGDRHQAGAADRSALRQASARLTLWLLEGAPEARRLGTVGALARWYHDEGAWVDLARQALRDHARPADPLGAAALTLVERVDAHRRALDRIFAEALVRLPLGEPSDGVGSVATLTRSLVAPFLADRPSRRLLVLLMDGMSAPVCRSLLTGLDGWGRVSWRPERQPPGWLPALAALPTLTATSRAAFFAGKLQARFGDEPESRDLERWRSNPAVAELGAEGEPPPLFLRAGVGDDAALSPELTQALRRSDLRLVAAVVNVVDEQLGGSGQVRVDWSTPRSVPVLRALLDEAERAGRCVLLVSDHGHVYPRQSLGRLAEGGGRRYRTVARGEALRDEELRLPEGCWRANGVAALVDETLAWGQGSGGAHGGLSLAEVVTPVALLAPERAAHRQNDPKLAVASDPPPAFWQLKAPVQVAAAASPTGPSSPSLQVGLFGTPPPQPSPPMAVAQGLHPLAAHLKASPRFAEVCHGRPAAQREDAILLVDRLLRKDPPMEGCDALAQALGEPWRRVERRVREASGLLSDGGLPLLELDLGARVLRLHLGALCEEYELR